VTARNPLVLVNGTPAELPAADSVKGINAADLSGTVAVSHGGTGVTTSTGSGSVVLSASPTLTGTLSTSLIQASGDIKTSAGMRVTGIVAFAGSTGSGLEIYYDTTADNANLLAYDRSASAYKVLNFQGSEAQFPVISTTASAANAFLDAANHNGLLRSTSSLRYKQNVEDMDTNLADAVLTLRPVWYRSKAERDNPNWGWWGLIAEEVAEIDPRLVHWGYLPEDYEETGTHQRVLKLGAELVPDAVQYDRIAVLLLSVVQRQEQRIAELERTLLGN
jgi:hypothetical protein